MQERIMQERTKIMKKLNVAVFFGGCSSEYSVSLESASAVMKNLDAERYQVIPVGITKEGDWYYYTGDISDIQADNWQRGEVCIPAALSPNRSAHNLLLLHTGNTSMAAVHADKTGASTAAVHVDKAGAPTARIDEIPIDVAFPVLHGKNGEDGTVQGAVALAGIPLAGCGVLASALCMDKDRAHKLAQLAGVSVPQALVLDKGSDRAQADYFAAQVGYPVFVKPVKAGSSYGITKVASPEHLQNAVTYAFTHDDQVIIEEAIDGFEVGCAVLGDGELIVGEVDEIELSGGFFDFTEKYTLKTSAIHVPARISQEKADEIKQAAKTIYRALGCSGFARVDLFLTPQGRVVFNEVNTIPGFTEHSRYPGMMKAAGHPFPEILDRIIQLAVNA